jgi:HrpA-like RNA helicase
VDPILTIAAALSNKSPFLSPYPFQSEESKRDLRKQQQSFLYPFTPHFPGIKKQKKKDCDEDSRSDHIATVHAFDAWDRVYRQQGKQQAVIFCKEFGLSHKGLLDIKALREHYREYLRSAGFSTTRLKPRSGVGSAVVAVEDEESGIEDGEDIPVRLDDIGEEKGLGDDEDEEEMGEVAPVSAVPITSGKQGSNKYKGKVATETVVVDTNDTGMIVQSEDLIRCALCAGIDFDHLLNEI